LSKISSYAIVGVLGTRRSERKGVEGLANPPKTKPEEAEDEGKDGGGKSPRELPTTKVK
jgi:hypothetical protein